MKRDASFKRKIIYISAIAVLLLPLAWLGSRLAPGMGYPPLYGIMIGLLVASTATSVIFLGWLRAALPAAVPGRERHR